MMNPVIRVNDTDANPVSGKVVYDYPKLFWNLGIFVTAAIFAPMTFSVEHLLVFIVFTYLSLLLGHSVGMHRMMIHRAFEAPLWLERTLIYVGVLVGMSGPFGVIKIHDLRDWAQRQKRCHDFFSHKRHYFQDLWWQLTCKFEFCHPPTISIEEKYSSDRFYQWLEKTWRWHQLGLAILLYLIGGWGYLVWAGLLRVSVSIIGHWSITYFCHNPGPGSWRVKDASVQASNIPGLGLITYGECWHNNHHAFPESARIGIEPGQWDPAGRLIEFLGHLGLAWNIGVPRPDEQREDLEPTARENDLRKTNLSGR